MRQPKVEIEHTKTYRKEQAVLRGKFIAINAYIKKKGKSNKQPKFIPEELEKKETKPKYSRKKEMRKSSVEINKIETRQTIEKSMILSWFFENKNRIDKTLAR